MAIIECFKACARREHESISAAAESAYHLARCDVNGFWGGEGPEAGLAVDDEVCSTQKSKSSGPGVQTVPGIVCRARFAFRNKAGDG